MAATLLPPYLLAFATAVTIGVRKPVVDPGFFGRGTAETRLEDAWSRAVQFHITLGATPYERRPVVNILDPHGKIETGVTHRKQTFDAVGIRHDRKSSRHLPKWGLPDSRISNPRQQKGPILAYTRIRKNSFQVSNVGAFFVFAWRFAYAKRGQQECTPICPPLNR
jgi:hypothetical protein